MGSTDSSRRYRIDFALIVLTGNLTRYKIVRPLVELDASVDSQWFPIRTWFAEDKLRVLPGALRIRARHLVDSWRFLTKNPPEAAVIHALETYPLYVALKKLLRHDVVIVNNHDAWPLRKWHAKYAVEHTDLFVMWTEWGARHLKATYPELPESRVAVIHPGINVPEWPMRKARPRGERFRLLFVGGDYPRKGGDTLVTALAEHLRDGFELDIATQSGYLAPAEKERILRTPNVRLHLDLTPNSPELRALYHDCDCFVLPTNEDCTPWVILESLCSGIPIVSTPVGAIAEAVQDGRTGLLVPPKDPAAIARAVTRYRDSPEFVDSVTAAGRRHVEENYDARRNTKKFLSAIKALIDERKEAQPISQERPATRSEEPLRTS